MTEADRTIESRLGYSFDDPELLRTALRHASLRAEGVKINERLEFLGDAVLGLAVAEHLYRKFPEADQGALTRMRADLVATSALVPVARELGLEQHLLIRGFGLPPTKALGDAVESLLGAIFLDAGWETACDVAIDLLSETMERASGSGADPRSLLQQWTQARNGSLPVYRVTCVSGPPHRRRFVVEVEACGRSLGTGEGRSKKEAASRAAQAALDVLERDTP